MAVFWMEYRMLNSEQEIKGNASGEGGERAANALWLLAFFAQRFVIFLFRLSPRSLRFFRLLFLRQASAPSNRAPYLCAFAIPKAWLVFRNFFSAHVFTATAGTLSLGAVFT